MSSLTPTEARIMAILEDGLMHTKDELHKCLWDELSSPKTVSTHISRMRRYLRPGGHDIILRKSQDHDGRRCYQLVRLLASPYR